MGQQREIQNHASLSSPTRYKVVHLEFTITSLSRVQSCCTTMHRPVQTCAEKRAVLLRTSLAWPAVAGYSRAETFSQLSAISFARPCTWLEYAARSPSGPNSVFVRSSRPMPTICQICKGGRTRRSHSAWPREDRHSPANFTLSEEDFFT